MARVAKRARRSARGSTTSRERVPSDDRGQRICRSDRRADRHGVAEGIASDCRGRSRAAGRSPRAKAGGALMPKRSQAAIDRRMKTVPGWTLEGNAIRKQYVFAGFPEAVQFVNRLVPEAEAADHHPDILINYKRVTLTYSTHSEG